MGHGRRDLPSSGDSQTQRLVILDQEQVCEFMDGIGWGERGHET